MTTRLDSNARLPDSVTQPSYDRARLKSGILHIGAGAFHRAHQVVYTDAALAAEFAGWGIEAVSLRSTNTVEALIRQDGLYSVLVRDGARNDARISGAITAAHSARQAPQHVLTRLADPNIRIVTLTVTEKAYGLDSARGGLDRDHRDIRYDLSAPTAPRGVIGHLVEGLARRRKTGGHPVTILCCDNLPSNGNVVRQLTLEFAGERDPALANWIAAEVAFPCCMVDRIVPASTDRTLADAEAILGCHDSLAVETEPFTQWVIEDRFMAGRPLWEAGGALFVDDVAPYERMKLRLLNGAHSLLAYIGQNRGLTYVRDVMAIPAHRQRVEAHMRATVRTLAPVSQIDLDAYISALLDRFANPALAHATAQIAMDGSQKLPQRLFAPAAELLDANEKIEIQARAVAEWIWFCCTQHTLNDPRERALLAAAEASSAAGGAPNPAPFLEIERLFPARLANSPAWQSALNDALAELAQELD